MKPTVLFVDDEPAILDVYRRKFRDRPEIKFAPSGTHAAEMLDDESEVALVITDLNMKGLNGMDLLRKVAEVSPKTLRYVMTGDPTAQSVLEAKEEGLVHHCLAKPFRLKEMEQTINGALEKYEG